MARPAEILQNSCHTMGTKFLQHSNHSISLAIRPLAARSASKGQTDGVIRMLQEFGAHRVARILQNFCRPGHSESSLDQNRSPKKFEHRGVAILARVQGI